MVIQFLNKKEKPNGQLVIVWEVETTTFASSALCWQTQCRPEVSTCASSAALGLYIHAVGLWRLEHKELKYHRASTRVSFW